VRATADQRYEIGELVASGGMADVFRGRDRVLDRPVAVKRLRGASEDEAARARFTREARVLAGFNHPNAVAVYDAEELDDGPVIVMEYVEGSTLRQVLRAEGRLPVERAVSIATQILDALEAAHARGIVHRDIKPGNVLVTEDGWVKLADFGIATMVDSLDVTASGEVLGTPKYLSPEQAVGERATPRSDLYAVGVLCFEMVCGRAPFEGDSPAATMSAHRRAPVPNLRERCPGAPGWYIAVVERALAKDPEQRYADAGAMRTALLAGARGDVTVADSTLPLPVVVTDPDTAAATRPTTWWPVLLFVALGLLVAAGVWALGDRDGTPLREEVPATESPTFPSSFTQPEATAPPTAPPTAPRAVVPVVPEDDDDDGDGDDEARGPAAREEKAPKPEKADRSGPGPGGKGGGKGEG
jgi:serine/threonine-protein kinase